MRTNSLNGWNITKAEWDEQKLKAETRRTETPSRFEMNEGSEQIRDAKNMDGHIRTRKRTKAFIYKGKRAIPVKREIGGEFRRRSFEARRGVCVLLPCACCVGRLLSCLLRILLYSVLLAMFFEQRLLLLDWGGFRYFYLFFGRELESAEWCRQRSWAKMSLQDIEELKANLSTYKEQLQQVRETYFGVPGVGL